MFVDYFILILVGFDLIFYFLLILVEKYRVVIAICQVTYTSDYFDDLYNLAVELIRKGRAYVDHQVSLGLQ